MRQVSPGKGCNCALAHLREFRGWRRYVVINVARGGPGKPGQTWSCVTSERYIRQWRMGMGWDFCCIESLDYSAAILPDSVVAEIRSLPESDSNTALQIRQTEGGCSVTAVVGFQQQKQCRVPRGRQ